MKGKYLYCIIKQPFSEKLLARRPVRRSSKSGRESLGVGGEIKGIDNGEIYCIDESKLSAVISDAEIKEYLPTRENLVTHQKVVEEIFKKCALLPISFGTVTKNSDEAKGLLRKNAGEILKIFKKIENKIELGLKVFWQNMPEIFEEIVKENREIQKARSNSRVNRNVMLAVGEMVAKALERKKTREAALILQPLLKIAQEVKENELFRDDMVLNVNFLVDRSKEKDFDLAINQLDEKYGQRMKFKYIGPVPPSNFIELHLTSS